jgi:protein tyrosine/serine phosphatase
MANFGTTTLSRFYNLHWVTPDVARSAQPYLGFYQTFLRANGIQSLINLRGENPTRLWWRQEHRAADALGLPYYNVRLSSRLIPAREPLIALVEALEQAPRPVLLKCSGGQDRASFAAATYLLLAGGKPAVEAARAQFAAWPYLHRPRRNQRWMQHFPAFANDAAGAERFGDWVRNGYDADAFADWLARHGEADSYLALQKA